MRRAGPVKVCSNRLLQRGRCIARTITQKQFGVHVLVVFVIGFLAGVLALQHVPALPLAADMQVWAMLAAACAAMLGIFRIAQFGTQRGRIVPVLWWVALALAAAALGFCYAHWRAETRLAHELPIEWEGRDIAVTGVVASLPTITERGTRFEFDIEAVHEPAAVVPSHVSLNWYVERGRKGNADTPPPTLAPGERWQLTVRLRRPHGTANPHGYDFEAFALERNIRATGYVRFRAANEKHTGVASGFRYRVDRARMHIRDRMNAVLKDQPHRGVLVALAVGEQSAIPQADWKVFWRTGVGHLMSISGLHITMMASLVYGLTFFVWARVRAWVTRIPAQRAAAAAGALAALAYSLIAGFSVPTQRTLFMLMVVAAHLWTSRAVTGSRVLAWALFAVLLLDPWAVLAPGFWLSFGAVAAIFYVTAHRTGKLSVWRAAVRTQVAVTFGLLPLTMVLFQEVSLISPVANAIAIPVISLVVVPLTLGGALLPFDFPLWIAHEVMALCHALLAMLADTPGAVWQSHAPPRWTLPVAAIGIAWMFLPRGAVPRVLGVFLLVPMFALQPQHPRESELWVTLLDVGQGLAAVVRTASHTLVYDTGPSYNPDADSGNRIVVPYLRGEGIRDLDALIVTHDDDDHTGGARSIIDARAPKWVMTSADRDRDIFQGAAEVMRCDTRDRWEWNQVAFEVLHPTKEDYLDDGRKTNSMGCVLKITASGGSVLLTADIERAEEAALLARSAENLKADVMLVPHHGSKTSSTDAFLDAVDPTLAILSVGYRNRFRHPHPSVMERYAARGIDVVRTDEAGAITLKFSADAAGVPTVSQYRREKNRYWVDLPRSGDTVE
jgi:competence protein ComEC